MQISKISRFPRQVREELNRRLDKSERGELILQWLNSLPEVQSVLNEEFAGEAVKKQNPTGWKKTGFRNWQLQQAALAFTQDVLPDDLDPAVLENMSAKLISCLQIRYAAVASTLPHPQDDPESELCRLASLCSNLNALRRGDLSAERLALEQKRLELENSRSQEEMEKRFWQWTTRPEVQEKLYANRDPDQIRRDVDRLITERMLGIRPEPATETSPDPACLI